MSKYIKLFCDKKVKRISLPENYLKLKESIKDSFELNFSKIKDIHIYHIDDDGDKIKIDNEFDYKQTQMFMEKENLKCLSLFFYIEKTEKQAPLKEVKEETVIDSDDSVLIIPREDLLDINESLSKFDFDPKDDELGEDKPSKSSLTPEDKIRVKCKFCPKKIRKFNLSVHEKTCQGKYHIREKFDLRKKRLVNRQHAILVKDMMLFGDYYKPKPKPENKWKIKSEGFKQFLKDKKYLNINTITINQ